jgi:hypothetical protein
MHSQNRVFTLISKLQHKSLHTETLAMLASLLLLVALLSRSNTAPASDSPDADIYSHSRCTVPFLDERPATHYRGTWGPQQFLDARNLKRVCVYSNVCVELVLDSSANSFDINFKSFVPALPPPGAENSTLLPPQYLGFEPFSHLDMPLQFDFLHHAIPNDYAWALDAGSHLTFCGARGLSLCLTRDSDVHFLTESYANNNFGHILIDDLYSVFHAMQHWGIGGYNNSRILSFRHCIPVRAHGLFARPCGIYSRTCFY